MAKHNGKRNEWNCARAAVVDVADVAGWEWVCVRVLWYDAFDIILRAQWLASQRDDLLVSFGRARHRCRYESV